MIIHTNLFQNYARARDWHKLFKFKFKSLATLMAAILSSGWPLLLRGVRSRFGCANIRVEVSRAGYLPVNRTCQELQLGFVLLGSSFTLGEHTM